MRNVLRSTRARAIAVLAVVACGGSTVAYGYFTAVSTPGNTNPQTGVRTLAAPSAPTASLSGSTVTVSIPQTSPGAGSTLLGSMTGGGYVVRRYADTATPNNNGTVVPAGTCSQSPRVSGAANPLTCTETPLPTGDWKYTATPVLNTFVGLESAASNVVDNTPVAVVAAPSNLAVSTASPGTSTTPTVTGTAPAGATVRIYTNATCTSASPTTATLTGTTFSGTPTAAANTTTSFYATATVNGTTSACSTSTASYTNDTTAPAPQSVVRGAPQGSATNNGKAEAGDQIVLTYSDTMRASTLCVDAGWPTNATSTTGSLSNATVTLTKSGSNTNITIDKCTNVGTVSSANTYAPGNGNPTFTNSTVTAAVVDGKTVLTIQLGTQGTTAPNTVPAAANVTWSPVVSGSTRSADLAGNLITGSTTPTSIALF